MKICFVLNSSRQILNFCRGRESENIFFIINKYFFFKVKHIIRVRKD